VHELMKWMFQWAEMLEKEFAGALAINSELEAAKKATADSLLKTTSTVAISLKSHHTCLTLSYTAY